MDLTGASIANHAKPVRTRVSGKMVPWLFVLPALLVNVFVVLGPTLGTVLLSLTDWNGFTSPNFVGLDNYARLSTDFNFYAALVNNLKWMAYFVTLPVAFGLLMAVLLRRLTRGQMFFRAAFFLPHILSSVLTVKIWSLIYNPFYGINVVAESFGIHFMPDYLGNLDLALFSVAFVDAWRFWPFLMVIFLTALHQTDTSLQEAAQIDGANKLQIFFSIVLPQLRPTIMMIIMIIMIWSFATFDYVFLMTGGGPANVTELLSTYMYKLALSKQEPGYASTIALSMGLFSAMIMGLFGFLKKKGWDI